MPYTHVQFIAYEIGTAPANTVWDDDVIDSGTYLGLKRLDLDVETRCRLMLRAIQTARDNLPHGSSPPTAPEDDGTTLTVFVAPEFFFRGPQGAYPMEDVQRAIGLLQAMVAEDRWKDWIFCFGTILGVSAPAIGSPPVIDPTTVKEVYNFSLIQKGGTAARGDAGARVVVKELKSGIDFIAGAATDDGLLWAAVEHLDPSRAPGPGREQQRVNYDGAGIFDLDGITWGLEICLDHDGEAGGRLLNSPQLPGAAEVQVQLVVSCGMSIVEENVVAKQGGYVFGCDGLGDASSNLERVEASMSEIGALSRHAVGDEDLSVDSVSPVESVRVNELYPDGAGEVAIYPAQPLPAASTVPGSVVPLTWRPCEDYHFEFRLIYDQVGVFKAVLVEPISRKARFYGKDFILPVSIEIFSSEAVEAGYEDPDVRISMKLVTGTDRFTHGVWCDIDLPGFDFHGNAFLFHGRAADGAPETI
ncbi:hypothetical protein [Nannocystis punicea]|uniref:Uncharacterized protein n=1 Tax=Nannocystis punicea TaxID=2995304 RepID=A0ABY7H9E6_9BACT|nr:hypothetical protein [Nannocystis poenicansa]WAS95659.1 hypothetical protein O0S08_05810 [Nannocystis poenicansa]